MKQKDQTEADERGDKQSAKITTLMALIPKGGGSIVCREYQDIEVVGK
jgi:hypothetical protein